MSRTDDLLKSVNDMARRADELAQRFDAISNGKSFKAAVKAAMEARDKKARQGTIVMEKRLQENRDRAMGILPPIQLTFPGYHK